MVSCGFVGYMPFAPGTWASLLGCILIYLFPFHSLITNIVFICILTIFSIISINMFEFTGEDPGYIVIDELIGMFITMAGHKTTFISLIAGFFLFRFFDIIKPYPVNAVESFRKGYGIVADDIIAGIYANIVLWLGYLLFYCIWK
ncbi:MAG TPA: phosphatidylglycerophosphatase A [Syntrophorhabdaceae bacterium]|nr:phosphatidylglycerophosphatase A [Syntrophorhabdaceae bacterium]